MKFQIFEKINLRRLFTSAGFEPKTVDPLLRFLVRGKLIGLQSAAVWLQSAAVWMQSGCTRMHSGCTRMHSLKRYFAKIVKQNGTWQKSHFQTVLCKNRQTKRYFAKSSKQNGTLQKPHFQTVPSGFQYLIHRFDVLVNTCRISP